MPAILKRILTGFALLTGLTVSAQDFSELGPMMEESNAKAMAAGESWPTGYPTNIAGYTALAYWPGDSYSGGVWVDYSGNGYDLTNGTAGARPGTETINGHTILTFDGVDDVLRNVDYTNLTVAEYVFLAYPQWEDALEKRFLTSSEQSLLFRRNATTGLGYFKSSSSPEILKTNTWIVFNLYSSSSANGGVLTNGSVFWNIGTGADIRPRGIALGGEISGWCECNKNKSS